MLIALIVAAMLAQPGPDASPTSPPPAKAEKPAKPAKPKLICEAETPTDSFIAHRVCRTPEQIEAERLKAKENTDWVGDRSAFCKGRPGC